ncbi:branched-chain amino acid ABC transporter permease [Castellaniella sp. GW247-6E4]|uniref:branched-chain amino acid ABC transporter permease n=1 Tax=Castellaniella sp. GW247-6E4 TaxID=3140380 RepID=UPI003315EEBC
MEILGYPLPAILAQLVVGLVNGSFYAMLSLGLAIIFGLLNVINMSHGAMYMLGAFATWMGLAYFDINYWIMLLIAPVIIGLIGVAIEKTMLRWLYKLDHLYGLLLTIGVASFLEGLMLSFFGVSGVSYSPPSVLGGALDLGFMMLPAYRAFVVLVSVVVCLGTWLAIEKTKLGAYLRAGTENPELVGAFGVNVPLLVTLTYGFGVGLAGLAGVLAAPTVQVSPLMGANLIVVVFAVVVIGGLNSILGSIVTGLALGVAEAVVSMFYPDASATVVFVIMAIVLVLRPAGLFGKEK